VPASYAKTTVTKSMTQPSPQPNLATVDDEPGGRAVFWLAVVLSGTGAGLVGGVLMRLLLATEHLAWNYESGTLLEAAKRDAPSRHVWMLLAAGMLVGLGNWLLDRTLGKSGEVSSAIWSDFGNVPIVATLARAVQSIVTVGMGSSLGREAAIKQSGGAIACGVARGLKLSPERRRVLVACGVGAGMAAAYNVPLGGALFAIEVLLGAMTLDLVLPALAMSAIATVASWALLPTGPIYHVPEYPLSVSLVLWSLATGPLCGLAAVFLIRSVAWAEAKKPRGWIAVLIPLAILGLLGLASIPFPDLLGNGKDTVENAFNDQARGSLLPVLPLLKLLAIVACLACGARGGLFTPTMMIGALVGGLLGHAWQLVLPGAPVGCCAVIGSCALLAAASQGPVSAVVLTLELTRHLDATMVPILLAVTGAMLVVRRLETRSIYSARAS
jgi:H+/Cl- antiporter ClcA